jgi:hypothetical protein
VIEAARPSLSIRACTARRAMATLAIVSPLYQGRADLHPELGGMKLRHLEWLIEERVANPKKAILYEILPYSPVQADVIIQHLCAFAKLDLEQANDDPARARRVRRAFGRIVDAARARQALLDLDKIERGVAKAPWRGRLRDLRHDRHQFATAIGDRDARIALRGALIDIGQTSRAGRHWLHYLRDHPAVLRKTIERALHAPVLQGELGQTQQARSRALRQEGGPRLQAFDRQALRPKHDVRDQEPAGRKTSGARPAAGLDLPRATRSGCQR